VANSAGTIRTASTMLAIAYMISALAGGAAMAILAGVLFLMKLLAYAMAFFLIIAALAGVVGQGFGSAMTFFKGWVGYTAITSMTTLLFAFVLMMASGLLRVGDGIFGQWALAMMIWIGLCPALSIIMLNWAFKKLFRTKSPFTLRGMQAMAGNPLAVAGATGAGGALVKNAFDSGRHKLQGAAWNAAKGRLSGGKASAESMSAAAGEELLGDAENPVPADKQVTSGAKGAVEGSAQQAVTDGTDQAEDAQAEGVKDGAVVADAETGSSGETTAATVEDGDGTDGDVSVDEGFDDSMLAGAINGPSEDGAGAVGSRSLGQRLTDFEDFGR